MLSLDVLRVERTLLVIALLFIIVIAVKMTSYLISLFLMSLIITLLGVPALFWLKKKGLPNLVAVLLITLVACSLIFVFVALTTLSFQTLLADLPQYQQELNTRLADVSAFIASLGLSSSASNTLSFDLEQVFANLGQVISMGVAGAKSIVDGLMFLFFVGVTSFFMLLEAPKIATRLEERFGKDSDTIQQFSRMTGYIIDFIVVRTETNAVHGLLFGGFLATMGVHAAVLWGLLTFLLGYIPYFGLVIAAIPAIFFAWLQFGVPGAVAVIAAVCVLNLVVENPVYSWLAARKFEVPALIVIISVIFWGWLLGLVGMLFSIPFTLIVLLIIQLSDDLRWINEFIGVGHLFEEKEGKKEG
jgi:predicted PurR-regulated permease PerM